MTSLRPRARWPISFCQKFWHIYMWQDKSILFAHLRFFTPGPPPHSQKITSLLKQSSASHS